MIGLNYLDTVKIVDGARNGYGDVVDQAEHTVKCLFLQTTGNGHLGNVEITEANSHAYLDPEDPFVVENGYRLEGMKVIANPFGTPETESWYKITTVVVGMDKLLGNEIDNIHVYMRKTSNS
jgi:hypothetical protein